MERFVTTAFFILTGILLISMGVMRHMDHREWTEERTELQKQISQKDREVENWRLYSQWLKTLNGDKGSKENPIELKKGDVVPNIAGWVKGVTVGEDVQVWFNPFNGSLHFDSRLDDGSDIPWLGLSSGSGTATAVGDYYPGGINCPEHKWIAPEHLTGENIETENMTTSELEALGFRYECIQGPININKE